MTCCLNKNINPRSKNWVSLIKSVEMRPKRIVGPKNCNLYHYAGNNPIKYTDPSGRDTEISFTKYVDKTFSNTTTTSVTSIKSDITIDEFNEKKDTIGFAWSTDKKSAVSILQDSLNALNTGYTVADLIATASGGTLLPPPYNIIVPGVFLLTSFLLDAANEDKLEIQLKKMYQFQREFQYYDKKPNIWKRVSFTVTETEVEKETYHDRNSPYTTTTKKKYLELQASFENIKTGEQKNIYKLMEIN